MANEKRLIDLDKLIENFKAKKVIECFPDWYNFSSMTKNTVIRFARAYREIISNQPAVDAVEVVRCKNCKYWEPIRYGYRTDGLCLCLSKYHDAERPGTEGDFYCAYGKKRESGTQPQREDV